MIDIVPLLENYNIDFRTSGKNVTSGWVEISCPFPGCSDPSYHLGINIKTGLFHCWICGEKGDIIKLVRELLQINYQEAKIIIQEFDTDPWEKEQKRNPAIKTKLEIPKEFTSDLPLIHSEYLAKRGFNATFLQNTYKLMACYQTGRFAYRLMIPIIMNDQIVNFTGRDVTGLQEAKYLHMHNDEAIVPMKHCLYNIDTVKDKIVIVEGCFDVFRLGRGSVAVFGTEYTTHQLNLLLEKSLKEAYVLFDSDAINKAEKLANVLSTFIPKVEVLALDGVKDPAEISDDEAKEIIKLIN